MAWLVALMHGQVPGEWVLRSALLGLIVEDYELREVPCTRIRYSLAG